MNAPSPAKAPKSPAIQADLFSPPRATPEGFRYQPEVISPDEEAALVEAMADLPFEPFDFQGFLANRHVVGYGLRYDYASRRLREAAPIPDWLLALRGKIGAFVEKPADSFRQVLINQYQPGAGIGWHRDKPQFDDVVGVSLVSDCSLRFRRKSGDGWARHTVPIEPRSAYWLSGPARTIWEHSITPLDQLRYSITFRTLVGER